MAYEPKTEAGKKAIADGADLSAIQAMEESGELTDAGAEQKPADEHIDTGGGEAETEEEKAAREAQEAEGLVAKLKELGVDAKADEGMDALKKKLEDAEGEGPDRRPQGMPMWKHKEELKKQEEALAAKHSEDLKAALAAAAAKAGGASDADIKAIADEFNLSPEVAGTLVDRIAGLVEKRVGLPEIRKSVEAGQQQAQAAAEEAGWRTEWSSKDTQDALAAIAGDKQVTAEVEKKVRELAYSTTYARYRLTDIIKLNASSLFPAAPKQQATAERGRGGAGRGIVQKGIDEMTPEEINALSDEEFLALSDSLGKGNSRFTKVTKPKKA